MTEYGYSVDVPEGYDEAVIRARMALRGEGFSILSEMHVGGLIEPVDGRQYLIMGVWNAAFSELQISPDLKAGVHLPCNVVVQEAKDGAIVAALDPMEVLDGEADVPSEVAGAARDALGRVLTKIATPS